jgi:SAM-dependent methyltransferase
LDHLTVTCKRCRRENASSYLVFPGEEDATPLCADCTAVVVEGARSEIVDRLSSQPPSPGEQVLHLPVELDECADWAVQRGDSSRRAELLEDVLQQVASRDGHWPVSYLDLGCSTGYFCHRMSALGLQSTGVDPMQEPIDVARLLDTFIRKERSEYLADDLYDYLGETRHERVDVISAFGVFEWLILRRSLEAGIEALTWLFQKTRRVCFIELDYTVKEESGDGLPAAIDRTWLQRVIEESGLFDQVRCYDADEHGLMRDLFVGFKSIGDLDGASGTLSERVLADDNFEADLVRHLSPYLEKLLRESPEGEYFQLLEEHGVHLTPVDHYQPIPDTRALDPNFWDYDKEAPGVDFNVEMQLELLTQRFPRFQDEYNDFASEPPPDRQGIYLMNESFSGTDALAYYCMVRNFSPARIIEVGSGPFTLLAVEAAKRNEQRPTLWVDPTNSDSIFHIPGLRVEPIEQFGVELCMQLEENDILFIDSSHVSRLGGDVNFLFLEILPRLKPGVLVQVHGVFLPMEYPKQWLEQRRFWNEQYLLQAFLAFNDAWEVLLANNFLGNKFIDEMKETFPNSPWWGGASFWMRRRPE